MHRYKDIDATRNILRQPRFDASQFIGQELSTIAIDGAESEHQIFSLFDELANHLTVLSEGIEDEVRQLQNDASTMEAQLLDELAEQMKRLVTVGKQVDELKTNFEFASEGAVTIGGKLSNFERERTQVTKSIQLLSYIQEFEQNASRFQAIHTMNADKLKSILPGDMPGKDWHEISHILHDLNCVIADTSREQQRIAESERIIIAVTEVVETELLGQFDLVLDDLMRNAQDAESLAKARVLASTLHLFNHGTSLQKRYIFGVIQKRIPSDAFFTGNAAMVKEDTLMSKIKQFVGSERERERDADEESSAGASANESEDEDDAQRNALSVRALPAQPQATRNSIVNVYTLNTAPTHINAPLSSFQLIDHLSGLFTMINRVCLEQFEIIRRVFPVHTIARVTRLLVQRIFSDPAFGIQARVDAILCPSPPLPPLPLSDYLDALLTVREKLTALNLLLIESTSDASMVGMGSESASLRKAKREGVYFSRNGHGNNKNNGSGNSSGKAMFSKSGESARDSRATSLAGSSRRPFESVKPIEEEEEELLEQDGKTQEEIDEERMRSDNEIRDFFDEQIAQVLGNYVAEYFDKEITHVRQQYTAQLRKIVDDSAVAFAGTVVLHIPHLKAEKLRSLSQITKGITRNLVKTVLAITTDSVVRMESIGRDDKKNLPVFTKELCLLQMGFLNDGIVLPCLKQATQLLLKNASNVYKQSITANTAAASNASSASHGAGAQGTPTSYGMISFDVLEFLAVIGYFREEFANNFQSIFQRPLSEFPNLLVICKDARKQAFQRLLHNSKETLYAWEVGIVLLIEKTFVNVQSKYDFAPKFDPIKEINGHLHGNTSVLAPTAACDAVCKTIISVTQAVRSKDKDLEMLDLDNIYWRPLGQQFVATLIAHIRKFKVSQSGSRQLLRDLEEYRHVAQVMNSAEALDMVICLETICHIFVVAANEVAKMIVEEMRHLDTSIVLALLRCRSDFGTRSQSEQYMKPLTAAYSGFKWDAALPWEGKKPLTVMAFNDAFALILNGAMNPQSVNASNNQDNHHIRMLGPKTLRKSSAMPLSALFLNDLAIRGANGEDATARSSLAQNSVSWKNSITMSATGAMSIDIHALDAAGRNNPYELDRQARSIAVASAATASANAYNPAAQFSPMTQSLINKYLPARPDDELNKQDTQQQSHKSTVRMSTQQPQTGQQQQQQLQVSRPDLVGIDSKRPSTRNAARPTTISSTADAAAAPVSSPTEQGHKAVSGATSSSAPTSAKSEHKGGVFKTMTGFFKGF